MERAVRASALARTMSGSRGSGEGASSHGRSLRGPGSFDGVIDGGTGRFAAAHGTFHAATLPDSDMQITAMIDAGQR